MAENKTHWLQNPNKNYLGHWDLPRNKDLVLTIDSAKWEFIENPKKRDSKGKPIKEEKRIIHWKEEGFKPMICNETNANSILQSTGVIYLEDSKGARVSLFVGKYKDNITKETIDCIRIRNSKQLNVQQIEEQLEILFNSKFDLIDEKHKESIEKVIKNKTTLSYHKVYKYLKSLK